MNLLNSSLLVAGFVIISSSTSAQTERFALRAAPVTLNGKTTIRVNWNPSIGWLPESPYKLFRVQGIQRIQISVPPQPKTMSQSLRNSVNKAQSAVGSVNNQKLFATVQRPPSSALSFQQSFAKVTSPGSIRRTTFVSKSPNLKPTLIDSTLSVRRNLIIGSVLNQRIQQELGLTAVDIDPPSKGTWSYELYTVEGGKDVLLGSVRGISLTAPAPPARPNNVVGLARDGIVGLRWDRSNASEEQQLGFIGFYVRRNGVLLSNKPVMIADINGKEPDAFYRDHVKEPGNYNYSVSSIDGFGRESLQSTVSVIVPEWRPPVPVSKFAGVSSTLVVRRPGRGSLTAAVPIPARPIVNLYWAKIIGTGIAYNIYRRDLDVAGAAQVLMTPVPIVGRQVVNPAAIIPVLLREPVNDNVQAESRDQVINRAKARARLSAELNSAPALTFDDFTVIPDHRYEYQIEAIRVSDKLLSQRFSSPVIEVPSPVVPSPVTGLSGAFTSSSATPLPRMANPPVRRIPVDTANFASAVRRNVGSDINLIQSQIIPPALRMISKDIAGSVSIAWSAPTGVTIGAVKVERETSNSGTITKELIGTVGPGVSTYKIEHPRGPGVTYNLIVTPVSRWGIVGQSTKLSVTVPPSLPISPPLPRNIELIDDGSFSVMISGDFSAQGVTQVTLMRDNIVVGSESVQPGIDEVMVKVPASSAIKGSYKAQAINKPANLVSPFSENVDVVPLAPPPAMPGNVVVTQTNGIPTITWSAPTIFAGSYLVYRSTESSGRMLISEVTATQYIDKTAAVGRTYVYSVVAKSTSKRLSKPVSAQPYRN